MTWNIIVTHNQIAPSAVRLLNEAGIAVHFSPPYTSSEELAEKARGLGVDAMMIRQGRISREVLSASPKLKVVVKHGVGVDNIDLVAAADLGIPVLRSMGSNAAVVAELAVTLAFALVKELPGLDNAIREGDWPKPRFIGRDIAGSHIGLVGYGAIGRETARRAAALGMKVSVFDPFAADAVRADGHEAADDLDALLPHLDVLSFHCPLTKGTRHLLNDERIARMKPTAVVVNTARGGVIDEDALARALHEGRIGGAGLDGFSVEPMAADNPLRSSPRTILTPHIGGVTEASSIAMAEIAARHIISVLRGESPDPRSLAHPAELAS